MIKYFQLLKNMYEINMSNRRKTVTSSANLPSEDGNQDKVNETESNTESTEDQTILEPSTNPIENIQQNPLQIQSSSHSDIFVEQFYKPLI